MRAREKRVAKAAVDPRKYVHVARALREEIQRRSAGSEPVRLPSYRQLMATYGVSLSTVRQAVDQLKAEGLVVAYPGKGMFGRPAPARSRADSVSIQDRLIVVIPDHHFADRESNPINWFVTYDRLLGITEKSRELNVAPRLITAPTLDALSAYSIPPDGVLLFPVPDVQEDFVNALTSRGVRCVLIDPVFAVSRYSVYVDTEKGTFDGLMALLASGRRRIGYLRSSLHNANHRGRLRAYRRALAEYDIPYQPELVRESRGSVESGYLAMQELLRLKALPDAVFASTDLRAYGAMQAIHEHGLRIPDDIAVLGFDDLVESQTTHPPLASVRVPRRESGAIAVEIAYGLLAGDPDVPESVTLETEYIHRESAGAGARSASRAGSTSG